MKKQLLAVLSVAGLLALSSPAHASSLEVSGMGTMSGVAGSFQLIYDRDLDITWLDYTKGYDTVSNLRAWAADLAVTVHGATYDNWRLPSTVNQPEVFGTDGTTTTGFNITTSEMGYLFYTELGNKGYYATDGSTQADYGLINKEPFANLVATGYFSDRYTYDTPGRDWYFDMYYGVQSVGGYSAGGYALAVFPGQIQAVPEPASLLLIGSGLAGLIGLGKRRRGH